jgi:hypothetical protein
MSNIYLILIGILLKNLINLVKVLSKEKLIYYSFLFKIDNECSLENVYLRRNKTFVHGLPVQVVQITAERVYNPITEFLYPYLYEFHF